MFIFSWVVTCWIRHQRRESSSKFYAQWSSKFCACKYHQPKMIPGLCYVRVFTPRSQRCPAPALTLFVLLWQLLQASEHVRGCRNFSSFSTCQAVSLTTVKENEGGRYISRIEYRTSRPMLTTSVTSLSLLLRTSWNVESNVKRDTGDRVVYVTFTCNVYIVYTKGLHTVITVSVPWSTATDNTKLCKPSHVNISTGLHLLDQLILEVFKLSLKNCVLYKYLQ